MYARSAITATPTTEPIAMPAIAPFESAVRLGGEVLVGRLVGADVEASVDRGGEAEGELLVVWGRLVRIGDYGEFVTRTTASTIMTRSW